MMKSQLSVGIMFVIFLFSSNLYAGPTYSFQAEPDNTGLIRLSWDGEAVEWNLERSTDFMNWRKIVSLPGDIFTFTDTEIENGILYYYRLTAVTGSDAMVSQELKIASGAGSQAIDGIVPLTFSSLLLWWDIPVQSTPEVVIETADMTNSNYRKSRIVDARQGWFILEDIESQRTILLRLGAVRDGQTISYGAPVIYNHLPPLADWCFLAGSAADLHNNRSTGMANYPFLLSSTEITNELYLRFCNETDRSYPPQVNLPGVKDTFQQFPDHPVVNVTWYNAVDFCNWLSDISSVPRAYDEQYRLINMAGIRLPLESEWERAATLASGIYPWGTESPFPELANFGVEKVEADTKKPYTQPVASYPPTPGGFYDLAGNVWEWCSDWYTETPGQHAINSEMKCIRGGSWCDPAEKLRSTWRGKLTPSIRLSTVGFRIARSFPEGLMPGNNAEWKREMSRND